MPTTQLLVKTRWTHKQKMHKAERVRCRHGCDTSTLCSKWSVNIIKQNEQKEWFVSALNYVVMDPNRSDIRLYETRCGVCFWRWFYAAALNLCNMLIILLYQTLSRLINRLIRPRSGGAVTLTLWWPGCTGLGGSDRLRPWLQTLIGWSGSNRTFRCNIDTRSHVCRGEECVSCL